MNILKGKKLKFIGLGSNLPSKIYGSPKSTLKIALKTLESLGIKILRLSSWYKSSPIPLSDQSWYVNAVAEIKTQLSPHQLVKTLLTIESKFGRQRAERNEARVIDLDLLIYNQIIMDNIIFEDIEVSVPHPRMNSRRFVLIPLKELEPCWHDPKSNSPIDLLIEKLPINQKVDLF